MAKIEFSAHEIELLKKTAEEYHKGGVDQARAFMMNSGIKFDVSDELMQFNAPEAGTVNSDGCYACFTCAIVFAATLALAWVTS